MFSVELFGDMPRPVLKDTEFGFDRVCEFASQFCTQTNSMTCIGMAKNEQKPGGKDAVRDEVAQRERTARGRNAFLFVGVRKYLWSAFDRQRLRLRKSAEGRRWRPLRFLSYALSEACRQKELSGNETE